MSWGGWQGVTPTACRQDLRLKPRCDAFLALLSDEVN